MLKTAATLALSKFMCVSAKFCEEHLLLLFKILETSREPAVRSNIVIALGDIAVCFSTIMDENSDRLYAGLHDKDLTVKKNTLMVLTHLILNGMIKVKGQLGEMAKCLEDDDKRISDLAHLFFTELSTKDKAIYNNLPDIISHLSSGAAPVNEETFCKSMKFIFTFVDKVRSSSLFRGVEADASPSAETRGRKHRREALPALPGCPRASSMARYRLLSFAAAVQLGDRGQEARRGSVRSLSVGRARANCASLQGYLSTKTSFTRRRSTSTSRRF